MLQFSPTFVVMLDCSTGCPWLACSNPSCNANTISLTPASNYHHVPDFPTLGPLPAVEPWFAEQRRIPRTRHRKIVRHPAAHRSHRRACY